MHVVNSKSGEDGGGEVLVKATDVSKRYCRSLKKSLWYGFQDILREFHFFSKADTSSRYRKRRDSQINETSFGAQIGFSDISENRADTSTSLELRPAEFWAVKNVTFELRRGECIGLMGHNGAGKTTLLKLLNGLIKPDLGKIEVKGRVGGVIALGAGFNPILSGRENIYINGSILGLKKKEIDAKFKEITDFAELWDFIEAPVQTYSSGMQVRLGFAIATAMVPDVLLLDEVLAVGDVAFRNKCSKKINELRKSCAVIFVSHSTEHIARICDRAILLSAGKVVQNLSVADCIRDYLIESNVAEHEGSLHINSPIISASVRAKEKEMLWLDRAEFEIYLTCLSSVSLSQIRFVFHSAVEEFAGESIYQAHNEMINLPDGESHISVAIGPIMLKPGFYQISVLLIDALGGILLWSRKEMHSEVRGTLTAGNAICQMPINHSITQPKIH